MRRTVPFTLLPDFCRALLPHELTPAVPLYVVAASTLPWHRAEPLAPTGLTGPTLDLDLQRDLRDQWRGPGPAMLIDDTRLDAEEIVGVAVHELGHIVDWLDGLLASIRFLTEAKLEPSDSRYTRPKLITVANTGVIPPEDRQRVHDSHGPQFVRTCLHLIDRAARQGIAVRWDHAIGDRGHRLPTHRYFDALQAGGEFERMRNLPLTMLAALSPPADFTALVLEEQAASSSAEESSSNAKDSDSSSDNEPHRLPDRASA